MHNSGYDKNCFFWPPRDNVMCQILSEDMEKTVTKSVQNCLNFNQNLSKLLKKNNKVQSY